MFFIDVPDLIVPLQIIFFFVLYSILYILGLHHSDKIIIYKLNVPHYLQTSLLYIFSPFNYIHPPSLLHYSNTQFYHCSLSFLFVTHTCPKESIPILKFFKFLDTNLIMLALLPSTHHICIKVIIPEKLLYLSPHPVNTAKNKDPLHSFLSANAKTNSFIRAVLSNGSWKW